MPLLVALLLFGSFIKLAPAPRCGYDRYQWYCKDECCDDISQVGCCHARDRGSSAADVWSSPWIYIVVAIAAIVLLACLFFYRNRLARRARAARLGRTYGGQASTEPPLRGGFLGTPENPLPSLPRYTPFNPTPAVATGGTTPSAASPSTGQVGASVERVQPKDSPPPYHLAVAEIPPPYRRAEDS